VSEYSSAIDLATNLIAKKGKDIVISRTVAGEFDPATGTDSTSTAQNMNVKAVELPASGGKIAALDLRFNLSSQVYDRLSFIMIAGEGLAFRPRPSDLAIIGGETWTVLGVTPLNPNVGEPIKYDIALRI